MHQFCRAHKSDALDFNIRLVSRGHSLATGHQVRSLSLSALADAETMGDWLARINVLGQQDVQASLKEGDR